MNTSLLEAMQTIQMGYDTTFEINEFGDYRIRSEIETVKDIFLFILFTKPGQYPSIPFLGYDIETKLYSYYDEITENSIMEDTCAQCEALREYFNNGTISIKKTMYQKQHPALLINIAGTESYPQGYMKDSVDIAGRYLIGITFDEMNKMVYDISARKGEE